MDRFKRTIKKMAAFAGGAIMVGAAVSGCLAALDDLPQPFVDASGNFDSFVVVGSLGWNPNAAFNADALSGMAKDVSVGIDVGAAFAQVSTSGTTGGTTTSVSDGVLVAAAGEEFGYAAGSNNIFDIDATYADGDLDILDDGDYKETKGDTDNSVSYTQELTFGDNTSELVFAENEGLNEDVGTFLQIVDGNELYTYTVNFPSDVEYTTTDADVNEDFKGSKIDLQGKTYTFSSADASPVTELELLSGSVQATQGEYTTQTYFVNGESYEVEVVVVADNAEPASVKLRVNGEVTDAMTEGDTEELSDGLEIGVDEVLPNEGSEAAGADQVTFYLGANKLTLSDGTDLEVNGDDIEDWDVITDFTTTDGTLETLEISATPENDMYLEAGDEIVDPVFGAWKIVFGGLVAQDTEMISASTSGDTGSVEFINNAGKEVEVNVVFDEDGVVVFGDDYDLIGTDAVVTTAAGAFTAVSNQAMFLGNGDDCNGNVDDGDCKNLDILVTALGGEARIFNLNAVNTAGGQYDLKDMSASKVYPDLTFGADENIGLISNFNLASDGDTIDATNIDNFDPTAHGAAGDLPAVKTENDALITFDIDGNRTLIVELFDGDDSSMGSFEFTDNGIDYNELEIDGLSLATDPIEKDSDTEVAVDADSWGSIWTYDSDGKDSLDITYTEDRVEADVYIAPTGAVATTVSTGAVNVNYINAATGIARTDQDFANNVPSANVILMAGPTVNELTSDLAAAGKTWTSTQWADKVDTAIVQLVEDAFGSYDALIIAGYDAKDTALAGKVVASRLINNNFAAELTGSMAEISTSGASTVNEVSFA